MLPIEENTDQCMRFMGDNIKKMIGEKYGFMLMVFPFGNNKGRVAHYISDADRETMIKTLREKANTLENKLDIPVVNNQIQ
jgi:hypothetical protein